MIDCEKERAPENGVEKLIASTCRSSLSFDGEEVTVTCLKSCPGDDLQDDCKCGTKVYKQGRAISEEELYKYGVGSLGTYDCAFAAIGTPLAELTALVRFQLTCLFYPFDLSRLERQTFLQMLVPLLEIQMHAPLHNAGKNHVKSLKLPFMKF